MLLVKLIVELLLRETLSYFHFHLIPLAAKKFVMTYHVQIKVMPLKELLDPQGKAVLGGLLNLGLKGVEDVRIGKHITLQIEAETEITARQVAEEASKKLLANPVMEFYEIEMIN
jgi:phosphoribosylformylglycinamidine synthase